MIDTYSWDESRTQLQALDPALVKALDAVYNEATEERRSVLRTATVSYDYGSHILDRGKPVSQDGNPLPAEFILDTSLPLGMVVSRAAEVTEVIIRSSERSGDDRFLPQTILGPGRFIGAFELLDRKSGLVANSGIDWDITAGSRNIYVTKNHLIERTQHAIRTKRLSVAGISKSAQLYEWLCSIPNFDAIRSDWKTTVLYFSREWFSDMTVLSTGHDVGPSRARELYHHLLERAWPMAARIRPNSSILYDFLREFGQDKNPSVIEAAYRVIDRLVLIRAGLHPCFSPTTQSDDLGPFGNIIDDILEPFVGCSSILRPCYLSKNQPAGYIKLSQMAPSLFNGRVNKNLDAALSVVTRSATAAILNRDTSALNALGWPHLLSGLSFRVPRVDSGEDSASAQPFICKITRDGGSRGGVRLTRAPDADFFNMYNPEEVPGDRCKFFSSSVRITINEAANGGD